MNNVIKNNYNRNACRENNKYNVALLEKLISFFCIVIAVFENEAVTAICHAIGIAAVATGTFFYASAIVGGTLSVTAALLYGALLIAVSALVFNVKSVKGE